MTELLAMAARYEALAYQLRERAGRHELAAVRYRRTARVLRRRASLVGRR